MASEYYLHLIHRKKRSRTLQDKKIEKSSKKGNTPLTKNTKENQSPKESNKKTLVTQEQQLGSEFDNDEKSNSRRNDDNNEDGKLLSSTASQLKKTLNDGDKDHHGKPNQKKQGIDKTNTSQQLQTSSEKSGMPHKLSSQKTKNKSGHESDSSNSWLNSTSYKKGDQKTNQTKISKKKEIQEASAPTEKQVEFDSSSSDGCPPYESGTDGSESDNDVLSKLGEKRGQIKNRLETPKKRSVQEILTSPKPRVKSTPLSKRLQSPLMPRIHSKQTSSTSKSKRKKSEFTRVPSLPSEEVRRSPRKVRKDNSKKKTKK